jgi:hypothetical protein
MVASQNGWVANDRSKVSSQLVPGTNVHLTVRSDAPGQLLIACAALFDKWVEDIDVSASFGTPDDWGYAEREIRGGGDLSNHASGTAIDLNATRHPLGTNPAANYSPAQIAAIHKIVGMTGGVVRWGGDYIGRKDGMHLEINDGQDLNSCQRALDTINAAVAQVLGGNPTPPPPGPAPHPQPQPTGNVEQIKRDQFDLTDTGFDTGGIDGVWGPKSVAACKAFQFAAHLAVDGICGDNTRAALHKVPSWHSHGNVPDDDGGYPARQWQQKLHDHGWHIELDGVWGAHSRSILRQFQQDKGLAVDGLRGPSSWSCLYCTTN